MKNRKCPYCGSNIAFGDYCCPSCGAVPPDDEYFTGGITGKTPGYKKTNTPTDRAQRLKNNKRMNTASAISTVVVVSLAVVKLAPHLSSFDMKNFAQDDSSSNTSYHLDSIDTSKLVYDGMKDWEEKYGSLFQNDISVPDFDASDFFDQSNLSSYRTEHFTYNSESGVIANRFFSLNADKNIWSLKGESSGESVSISSKRADVTVTCLYNSNEMNNVSSEEAAQSAYNALCQTDALVNEPFEYNIGDVTAHAVEWQDQNSEDFNTRLFISDVNVILQIDMTGHYLLIKEDADYSEGKEEVDGLLSSIEIYGRSGGTADLYTDETIVSKDNGVYKSSTVSFEVGDEWKEEECDSGRLFSVDGVQLGIEVKYLHAQNKMLRLSSYEAANFYRSELSKLSDDISLEFEKPGNDIGCYSLTLNYDSEEGTHRLKYYIFTYEDTLVKISLDGTYEQLDKNYDKVNAVISSVKILSETEIPSGTMQGVNLKNYAVSAEYEADYYVRSDFASMWVDPENWTLTKEAEDSGQMSFTYDHKEDAALFLTFSQSDLIKKYTPYQLAEYYSKNLGKNADYEFVSLENGRLGEYESGDLHMKCFKDEPIELYMKVIKKEDKAFMVYWMMSGGGIAEAEDNIEKMLATFKFE